MQNRPLSRPLNQACKMAQHFGTPPARLKQVPIYTYDALPRVEQDRSNIPGQNSPGNRQLQTPPADKTSRGSRSPRKNPTASRALHVPTAAFFPSPISTRPHHTSTKAVPRAPLCLPYPVYEYHAILSSVATLPALRVVGALLGVTWPRKRGEPEQGRDGMVGA